MLQMTKLGPEHGFKLAHLMAEKFFGVTQVLQKQNFQGFLVFQQFL